MILDTENNTTGNNEAEEKKKQETPQSIFENRLAELNNRKTGVEQEMPAAAENHAGSIIAGVIADHEVIPPAAPIPHAAAAVNYPSQPDQTLAQADETGSGTGPPIPEPVAAAPEEKPAEAESDPVAVMATPTSPETETVPTQVQPETPQAETVTTQMQPSTQEAETENAIAAQAPEEINPALTGEPAEAAPAAPGINLSAGPVSTQMPEAAGETQPPAFAASDAPSQLAAEPALAAIAPPGAGESQEEDTSTAASAPMEPATAAQPEAAIATAASTPVSPGAPALAMTGEEHHDDHHDDHHEELVPETDYSVLPVNELRQLLMTALKTASRKNSRQIYDMHRQYETKIAGEKTEAQQRFIAEGNDADDFEYNTGLAHQEIEQAFQLFRENRNRDQRQEEEQRVKNSQRKNELLEQLREMVETPETRSSSDKIKSIQAEWKTIGPVPTADSQQMWSSYHALLDIFYNNRSIFFELKELDRRKNLQHKLHLCERAEGLADNPSINTALQELRNLHEEWKNVGPVPNEFRDSIWERFIQASEKIHARKKEFISERRVQEQDNLNKKQDLLSRIANYQAYQTDRINDWRDKTDEIQKLKEEWDSIGLVPKEKADEVNKQFWATYKAFFNHKNAFFKSLDEQKMQNLRLKTELCEQAETLKESTEWDDTKEKLIQLQKKWKTIGRVPDKYSDKLWNRFRAACNEFFDRKQNQVQQKEVALNKASAEKTALYDEVAARLATLKEQPGTLEELEALRTKWVSLDSTRGHNKVDDRFFELLQKYVDSIAGLGTEEKEGINLELQVDHIRQSPDAAHRIQQKEQSIRKEIAHLESDIRTLKTNIEFFGRSKNAEKLKEEYQIRIDEADHRIQILQQQLYAFRNA